MQSQDWASLFDDEVSRRATLLEGRLVADPTIFSVPITGRSVSLPSGLVAGQRVFEFLARLTWPAHDVTDFRRLPRPFGAVVTDLRTGQAVLLDRGFLPLAIRASMSLPSLFAPVEIDGRVFVDGGLVRNLPAEDARALGADVLVCVDVSAPPPPEDEAFTAGSLLDVLLRTALFRAEANAAEQRALCDLVITPDIGGLSSFSFDRAATWIARGEEAARTKQAEIEALVARLGTPAPVALPSPRTEPVAVHTIEIRGAEPQEVRRVRRRLGLRPPVRVGPGEIERAVERVYGMGAFDLVTYRHLPDTTASGTPAERLVVDVTPGQEDRLGFGFRYDERYDAALLFTLTLQNRLLYGSRTRLAVRLGQQTQLEASTFARIGVATPLRTGAKAGYTSVPLNLFNPLGSTGQAFASVEVDVYGAQLFVGPAISEAALLSFALIGEHARINPVVVPLFDDPDGPPEAESDVDLTSTFVSAAAFFFLDTQNRSYFPSRGVSFFGKVEIADAALGSGATFQHLVADARFALPVTRSVSLIGRTAFTQGEGDDLPLHYLTFLGGADPPTL